MSSPPEGNANAPINTGADSQNRSGQLLLVSGSGFFAGDMPGFYVDSTVKIGASGKMRNSVYKLDVTGPANVDALCIQEDCKSTWPSAADSAWKAATVDSALNGGIYYGLRTVDGTQVIDQRVGIGTLNPQAKLDIFGNSSTYPVVNITGTDVDGRYPGNNTASNPAGLAPDHTTLHLNSRGGPPLFVEANNADALIVDATGNVGIGTQSPTNKLTVKIATIGDGFAVDGSSSGSLSPQFSLTMDGVQRAAYGLATAGGHYASFAGVGDTVLRALGGSGNLVITNQENGSIVFASGASPQTDTVKAVITSSGNVGIGTAAPGAKLEVAGQVKITDGTQGSNKVLTSDANGLASWQAISSSQWTNGTNNAISYSLGSVGIGTQSPAGSLDVAGVISETRQNRSGIRLGVGPLSDHTPRFLLEDANSPTLWEIDNSVGTMRFFQPTGVKMSLAANGDLGVAGKVTASGGLVIPTGASAGRVLTSDANGLASWAPGGGTVTGVTASAPLLSNGTAAVPNISLPTACTSGQILKYDGTKWACNTAVSSGDTITNTTINNSSLTNITNISATAETVTTLTVTNTSVSNSFNLGNNYFTTAALNTCAVGQILKVSTVDAAGKISWACAADATGGSGTVTAVAGATANYVPKFTGATSLGQSQIFDNGTNVGIGTPTPGEKLAVYGGGGIQWTDSTAGGETWRLGKNGTAPTTNGWVFLNRGTTANTYASLALGKLWAYDSVNLAYSSGSVGIGAIVTPAAKLDIAGNLNVSTTGKFGDSLTTMGSVIVSAAGYFGQTNSTALPAVVLSDGSSLALPQGGVKGAAGSGAPATQYPERLFESSGWNFTIPSTANFKILNSDGSTPLVRIDGSGNMVVTGNTTVTGNLEAKGVTKATGGFVMPVINSTDAAAYAAWCNGTAPAGTPNGQMWLCN